MVSEHQKQSRSGVPDKVAISKKNHQLAPYVFLAIIALFSLGTKLSTLEVGAPYVTIDDQTMYKGGFLVWFGQAPPQRMYLESWISGVTSISTYIAMNIGEQNVLGLNLIADAYRDFYQNPDPYVIAHRSVMLVMDMLTALLVFLLGRELFRSHKNREWTAALAAALYLLSFNTLWSYVVARPDTLTAFLSVAGMYLYYRSDFGNNRQTFILSGVVLGLATGMKLHGAFFVIFICLDMLRIFGFREGLKKVLAFGVVSIVVFAVATGSLLFDPALYIKLRLLNARDDASPWLEWGDQFVTILRGTGWLIIPLLFGTAWYAWRSGKWHTDQRLASLIFIALCWLVLFSSLRVLRAYWMLPALPLFYLIAAYGIGQISSRVLKSSITGVLVIALGSQLLLEMNSFRSVPYNELRSWIRSNVQPEEPFYVLGYTAINLPLNTEAIESHNREIEKGLAQAVVQGESFTYRHIRLWEERSRQALFDMLNFKSEQGYHYYGYNSFQPETMNEQIQLHEMAYILLQQGFDLGSEPEVAELLQQEYTEVASLVGPGGGGRGLLYRVYGRK